MAADILVYKADLVPVGEDQIQHLELTRELARKFNHHFGQTFPEPEAYVAQTARIKALSDPTKKMSKSIPGGTVALSEEPEQIRKLVRRAVTDAGPGDSGEMSPGVKNLFDLLEAFAEPDVVSTLKGDYDRGELRYVDLKDAVAEAMIVKLTPIREKRAELLANRREVIEVLGAGAEKARALARETIREVKERMGFILEEVRR